MSGSGSGGNADQTVQAAAGAVNVQDQQTYAGAGPGTTPTTPADATTAPEGLPAQQPPPGIADPDAPPVVHLGTQQAPPAAATGAQPAQTAETSTAAIGPLGTAPPQPMIGGVRLPPVRPMKRAASLGPTGRQGRNPRRDGDSPDLSAFPTSPGPMASITTSPVRMSIATAENSPENPARRATTTDADVLQNLVATMLAMQQSLAQLAERLEKTEGKKEDAPKIDHKDIQKPDKYSGQKWDLWSEEFKGFLRRRDRRWATLLDEVQAKSKAPLNEQDYIFIQFKMNITDDEVYFAFQQQLYEYLKTYTTGEPLAMVLANGVTRSLETWRRLADQGRSARDRPMRDERRALYHPKQANLEGVVEAISAWEKKLAEYNRVKKDDVMTDEDKIMCIEDMCPEVLQRHLSEQHAHGRISTYNQYKTAIDEFFYNERRWGKRAAGLKHVEPAEHADHQCPHAHPHEDPGKVDADADGNWTSELMQQINALVRNKFKGKGKGNFSGSGPNPGKGSAMEVDSNGAQKPNDARKRTCYECGEEGHIGRECPVRQARVAAGGPPILPKGGKDGKGGKNGFSKGGKAGKGSGGKGWWPNQTEWRQMYPGPSPSLWNSWYSHAGQGKPNTNLFDIPQALSPLAPQVGSSMSPIQQLFQPGTAFGAYCFTEKNKKIQGENGIKDKYRVKRIEAEKFVHPNAFGALQAGDEKVEESSPRGSILVQVKDIIKPASANKARRQARKSRKQAQVSQPKVIVENFDDEIKAHGDAMQAVMRTESEITNPQNDFDGKVHERTCEEEDDAEYEAERQWDVMKANIAIDVPTYQHVPLARPHRRNRLDARKREASPTPTVLGSGIARDWSLETAVGQLPEHLAYRIWAFIDGDVEEILQEQRENGITPLPSSLAQTIWALQGPRQDEEELERTADGHVHGTPDQPVVEDMTSLQEFASQAEFSTPAKVLKSLNMLNVFMPKTDKQSLNPITKQSSLPPRKPGQFEELVAIVDSGATVPVLHPKVGTGYDLEESAASKAGIEYEVANGDTLPNLGQKRMAVLTQEGTLRGYQSQCADVTKTLQSVRAMVASANAVCFGLGPEGNDHLIINRVTGEVNRMEDDGINYLQRLLIVPQDQISAVQQRINEHWRGNGEAQDFPGQGR